MSTASDRNDPRLTHGVDTALRAELPERIKRRVIIDPESGCWLWTGPTARGYGQIYLDGKMQLVHRVSYRTLVGEIPGGLQLDHVKARGCLYKNCCNPAHLEPVTQRENILRGTGPSAECARRTHCDKGHEFTPANTRIKTDGARACRICARDYSRERARRAGAVPHPPKDRSHCKNGHDWTPENVYLRPSDGASYCRICNSESRQKSSRKSGAR